MSDNRSVIQEAFERWTAGTAPITDVFAESMTWRIEGRSVVAGSFADKQDFVARVLAPFGARFAADGAERFRPIDVRSVTAEGDTVVVVWDGHGVANDGVAYDNSYAWIMRVADGLVVDGVAFFDSIAFDELWTRVALPVVAE